MKDVHSLILLAHILWLELLSLMRKIKSASDVLKAKQSKDRKYITKLLTEVMFSSFAEGISKTSVSLVFARA